MSLQTTSSQTIGPYLHIGTTWLVTEDLTAPGVTGEPVAIDGRVLDGDGKPVIDALVEIWQANAHGRYAHPEDTRDLPLEPGFSGFGRSQTDEQGRFRFTTIKPGRVPGADGTLQAPHLNVTIFMRGILKHLITRMYFPDDPANATDPVLGLVPEARRGTLVARGAKPGVLAWEVILQGDGETVFFEC
jgi:protocatechuate 3,4-dioxygenase alpha subunit